MSNPWEQSRRAEVEAIAKRLRALADDRTASPLGQAADLLEQQCSEAEKLREEQRSALAADEFRDLPTTPKPGPSASCAEGDHDACLLPGCTCDCHADSGGKEGA